MNNIKLLQVVNDAFVLPYFFGDQFTFLKQNNVDTWVACEASSFLRHYMTKMEVPYYTVAIKRSISPMQDLKAIYQLYKIIRQHHIDVVFGHTPKGAMVAMIAAYLAGVKQRVYFRHGLVFETSTGIKRKLLKTIENITAKLSTTIVNVSPSVLSKAQREGIWSKEKNMVLGKGTCNGVDVERFTPKMEGAYDSALRTELRIGQDGFVLGYVGRLVMDKGIVELVEAWSLVEKENNQAKLLLVGPYEKRNSLPPEVIEKINKSPNIIHVDFTEDVVPYYQLMDVLILPSYREGFPTVALEASAMGLPILTTRATGCVDAIIENHTGMFIEHSPEDIAENIIKYMKNPEIRRSHGENGRAYVLENFKQEYIWDEIRTKLLHV